MLGRRVDAWFFCHDTNPHSGAPLLQVMRLLPDLSVGCAPVQARSLTPSTLSWLDGTTGNATTGTYTFDGDALTYAIYIGNRQQPDALIEGEGVVASGGFEVATHSHATDFHDQKSYRVFSDALPATVPS